MEFVKNWTDLFLFLVALKAIFSLYLNRRNENHIKDCGELVIEKLGNRVKEADIETSIDYNRVRLKLDRLKIFIGTLMVLFWTLGGGLNFIYFHASSISHNAYVIASILFIMMGTISLIISLPMQWYSTFVIEEKFGFNKSTPKIFWMDLLKQSILSVALVLPLFLLVCKIISSFESWWLVAGVVVAIFQITIFLLYPRIIAPLFNKFTPLPEGETKNLLVELAKRSEFPLDDIHVMDASKRSQHGNAYFTGFHKSKRIVLFDSLIQQLKPSELRAVLAHEIGHYKKGHIPKLILQNIVFLFLGFFVLSLLLKSSLFFQMHGVLFMDQVLGMLLFSIISDSYLFFLMPINAKLSRKYEFQADNFACEYCPPEDMKSALISLHEKNAQLIIPDPLYSNFYYSHPPFLERINQMGNKN